MNSRDLIKILTEHRNDPQFGAPTAEQLERSQTRLMETLEISQAEMNRPYSWYEYGEFYFAQTRGFVLRPLAVGFSMFTLVFGGWVMGVNASFDSLPGDTLYPVKRATEQIQLTFAGDDQRARLHLEFADRRLDEVSDLSVLNVEGKEERMQVAIDGFRTEIEGAKTALQSVQTADINAGAELAKVVERRSEEFVETIEASTPTLTGDNQTAAVEAATAADDVNTEAVNVIVSAHEGEEPAIDEDLQQTFQTDLADIDARTKLVLGRIAVIESVLEENNLTAEASLTERLEEFRLSTFSFQKQIADAMDFLGAGGYRRAFELIQEIDDQLSIAEGAVAELEIEITTELIVEEEPVTEPAEPVEPVAPSEEPEAEPQF